MSSNRSLILSRSRMAYRNGVKAPMSAVNDPKAIRWEEIRLSSQTITRMYSARSGASIPASFSTAHAQAQEHPEHPVGAGVLRPHVDEHLLGVERFRRRRHILIPW